MNELLQYKAGTEKALHAAIDAHTKSLLRSAHWERDVLKRVRAIVTAGKLLRGSLLCFAYKATSNMRLNKNIYKVAAVIELLHTALLIHDDVMDQDILRRGKPTLHKQYQDYLGQNEISQHGGESLAICAGDYVLFLAVELMAEAKLHGKAQQLLMRQLQAVCAGQMHDVYNGMNKTIPKKSEIFWVMQQKTASYSISLPLVLGAMLGDSLPSDRARLNELGLLIGTLFQIRDDELGVIGSEQLLGKPIGSDIREGKKTLLYYYLMKAASSTKDQKFLLHVFGNPKATQNDISRVQKMVVDYKIHDKLKKDMDKLYRDAGKKINELTYDVSIKNTLYELAQYCMTRDM